MILGIDTETYKWNEKEAYYEKSFDKNVFTIGTVMSEKGDSRVFTQPHAMWKHLIETIEENAKKKQNTYIYAHNMAFDYYRMNTKDLLNPKIHYIAPKSPFAIYDAQNGKKGYFLDTYTFYPMTLKEMGVILQKPKLEMPLRPETLEEILPYNKRDVEVVLEGVKRVRELLSQLGYKPRKLLTAGQLSMTSFLTYCRRKGLNKYFMSKYRREGRNTYSIVKTRYKDKILQAYRGARNQAYKTGKYRDCYLYDATAFYWKAMTEMRFPDLHSEQYISYMDIKTLKQLLKQRDIGIARVTIHNHDVPEKDLPYLPIRFADYLLFPQKKTMTGTWTYLELRKALELGYIITNVEWTIIYRTSTVNPLQHFIRELWELRKEAPIEMKYVLKLIGNNLYGKFAQRRQNKDYKLVLRADVEAYLLNGYRIHATIGENYVITKNKGIYEPSYVNPLISALITAWARNRLYEDLVKIPRENLLYVDTDGFITWKNQDKNVELGGEMGQYKIEAKGTCKILGEKRYYIDTLVKIGGVPKESAYKELIENEDVTKGKRIIGLSDAMRKGDLALAGTIQEREYVVQEHSKLEAITPEHIKQPE